MSKKIERASQILELKMRGWSYARIAKKYGLSPQRIQAIISPPRAINQLVIARAHQKCEKCGTELNHSGQIHHRNYIEDDYNDLSQLQYLCIRCHVLAHYESKPKEVDKWKLHLQILPIAKESKLKGKAFWEHYWELRNKSG